MIPSSRALALLALSSLLVSCQNGKSPFSSGGGAEDPYVSNYPSDGGFNPYPDQPGSISGRAPSYETPVAPVEADPYAFNAANQAPARPSATASKPKSTASSKPKSYTSSKPKSSSAKKSPSLHTVAKGDTLYGIALKNKTTVAKIKAANGLSSDLIRPGQKLKLR